MTEVNDTAQGSGAAVAGIPTGDVQPSVPAAPAPGSAVPSPPPAAPTGLGQDGTEEVEIDAADASPEPIEAPEKSDVEEETEDVLEIILPSADPREWTVGENVYTQKPLSYVRKMQFFALIARSLKKAMDQGGVNAAADLLGGGVSVVNPTAVLGGQQLDDAGSFMSLIFSLVEYAPELILDSYCIWLNVPLAQRPWVKAAWEGEFEENGIEALSDEDGIEIIKVFIVQNWDAIQTFFREHVPEVVGAARKQAADSSADEE